MKAQGTDGTSRGHHKERVSLGHNMLSYIPFDETALKRSQSLKSWIQSWVGSKAEFLEPKDWFEKDHDIKGDDLNDHGMNVPNIVRGTFIWCPPPAASDLRYHSPDPTSPSDKLLEACIRRMTLDTFWSRAAPTVKGQTDNLRHALAYSATVGLPGPFMHASPLPDYNHCGYEVAIQMLLYSRSRGNHSTDYVQFDSIGKFRSVYGIFYKLLLRQIVFLFLLETRREDISYSPRTHVALYGLRALCRE
eukprot:scaffold291974_cov51-Attheya_sp.AAC.1